VVVAVADIMVAVVAEALIARHIVPAAAVAAVAHLILTPLSHLLLI
jgi:hypothetical protein